MTLVPPSTPGATFSCAERDGDDVSVPLDLLDELRSCPDRAAEREGVEVRPVEMGDGTTMGVARADWLEDEADLVSD